jgi:hypothetical protein
LLRGIEMIFAQIPDAIIVRRPRSKIAAYSLVPASPHANVSFSDYGMGRGRQPPKHCKVLPTSSESTTRSSI